jgi:N-acetylglutamate synthase-like GNAT family acetyltransferase
MHTYFVGDEEVRCYARDLLRRLKTFVQIPTVWCPVTQSGDQMLNALLEQVKQYYPDLLETVQLLPIEVDDGNIGFLEENFASIIAGQAVLIIDGAIHSGKMMRRCAQTILSHGPAELSSYSLVVKRGSVFIPTIWGFMMDETDRAFFMLEEIPNNRLNSGTDRAQSAVQLLLLSEDDLKQAPVISDVKSIDRITWSDRHFEMKATDFETCTYVLKRSQTIVGFLTIKLFELGKLLVSEVVVDKTQQKHGYGGVLLRFADTIARQTNCRSVLLHAIKNKIEFYEYCGYRLMSGEPIPLDDEMYYAMERSLLYHDGPWR